MLKLYNTLTRKVEDFKPLGEVVKIYTCGPTVYGFPHIGNFAAYTYWDLLVRTLLADGYKVKRVLNLTDVGHLTSDGDNGEDQTGQHEDEIRPVEAIIIEVGHNFLLRNRWDP